jgi:hypothetical protein
MNFELVFRILSIATVSLIVALGIMLLTGVFIPPAVPERLRLMMGPVMLVYGGYRVWALWKRRPQPSDTTDDNDPL